MASEVTSNEAEVQFDLDNLTSEINRNLESYINKMCTEMAEQAKGSYDNAEYTGESIILVIPKQEGFRGSVEAQGETVGFVEFGTGVTNPEHPMAGDLDIHHGTFGRGYASDPKGWSYVGEQGNSSQTVPYQHRDGTVVDGRWWTTGIPANMGMYQAAQHGIEMISPERLKEEILANCTK